MVQQVINSFNKVRQILGLALLTKSVAAAHLASQFSFSMNAGLEPPH